MWQARDPNDVKRNYRLLIDVISMQVYRYVHKITVLEKEK